MKYTTTLTGINAYIEETLKIIELYKGGFKIKEIKDKIINENLFKKKSKSIKEKIVISTINRYNLNDKQKDDIFIKFLGSNEIGISEKKQILWYHFTEKEQILYDIAINFLQPEINRNPDLNDINTSVVLDFLVMQEKTHPEIKNWATSTKKKIGRKVVTLLHKFGLAENNKLKKPYFSLNLLSYVLMDKQDKDIKINSDLFKLFLLNKKDVEMIFSEAEGEGLVEVTYNNEHYNIEPNLKKVRGYLNASI
ncbi:hypothetical protein JCM16358_11670 [Halanaerocella petrolearia]